VTEPDRQLREEAGAWTGRRFRQARSEPAGRAAGRGGDDRSQHRPEPQPALKTLGDSFVLAEQLEKTPGERQGATAGRPRGEAAGLRAA